MCAVTVPPDVERDTADSIDSRVRSAARRRLLGRSRRFRLVPPAVTPIRASDIAAGVVGQRRGRGRDRFRRAIEGFLDAEGSATYTSFRRTLGACLRELAAAADDGRTRVLVPAFCSSDFEDAIDGVGLDPVRYDVDPETLSFDRASLDDELDPAPLAVVAVNVLGYGSAMAELASTCERRGVYLVEALGYALGTEYRGKRLGTFGDCAVLNFQQGKPLPIGGGMVVNRCPDLRFGDEGRPAVDSNSGILAGYAAFSRPRPYYAYTRLIDLLGELGWTGRVTTHPESKLDVAYAPPFATISDFQGTVGRRIFDRLDDHRDRRTQTAEFYVAELSDCPGVRGLTPVEGLSTLQHVRYPIVLATEALRDRLRDALLSTGVQATTLYDWPIIDPDVFPGAGRLQREILTLPTHPYVDERDRRSIVETIRETVAEHPAES